MRTLRLAMCSAEEKLLAMRVFDSGDVKSGGDDAFEIRMGRGKPVRFGPLGGRLTKLMSGRRMASGGSVGASARGAMAGNAFDARQRAIVKVAFKSHGKSGGKSHGGGGGGFAGGGSGGGLSAHGRYLERDGAGRDNEKGQFFDRENEALDRVQDRLQVWERDDPRHFRIVLAPESGARIIGEDGHLREYARDVMSGMERDLGQRLEWLGVEHANTDNPHVHVIVRGVREDGLDLKIPRDYMAHGLRECARDVATERLGPRGLDDERLRLEREIHARGLNRLDQALARELDQDKRVRLQDLGRDHAPGFGDSLRARALELQSRGLAVEVRRNVLEFVPGWKEKLEAAKSLDVARELRTARLYETRMGRLEGQVLELGPRGENPDRAVLILETPDHGRVLVNTSREAIQDLQQGSLAALEPNGRRPDIERLSFYSPAQQLMARADTELDRELDRIARGEARLLPKLDNVERCLAERATHHVAHNYGEIDANGNFAFKHGARDYLHALERNETGRAIAAERGREFRDSPHVDENWRVQGAREMFSGRAAVLERSLDVTVAPLAKGQNPEIGKDVSLKTMRAPELGLSQTLQIAPALSRGLELGR